MPTITGSFTIVKQLAAATNSFNVSYAGGPETFFNVSKVSGPNNHINLTQFTSVASSFFNIGSVGNIGSYFKLLSVVSINGAFNEALFNADFTGYSVIHKVAGKIQIDQLDQSVYFPGNDNTIRTSPEFDKYVSSYFNIDRYTLFGRIPTDTVISIVSKSHSGAFNIVNWDEVEGELAYRRISDSDDVLVQDDYPPFFASQSPSSDQRMVGPSQNVVFHVKDNYAGIDNSELNLYINTDHVVTDGVITVSGGALTKNVININDYEFIYNPTADFNLHQTITVSGVFSDLEIPANSTASSYTFTTWDYFSLSGTLTCVPDIDGPVVTPHYPGATSTGISPSASVIFAVDDYVTGVDLSSLVFNIDSSSIYTGGATVTSSGIVMVMTTPSGYIVQYDPTTNWQFGSTHNVYVSAADNYGPAPNITILEYNFTIIEDDTLIIRNFFMNLNESRYVEESTSITIEVIDYTFGVDPTGTYFVINGEQVSTTLVPIESGQGYLLSYDPPNDFNYDTIISVEVVARSNL